MFFALFLLLPARYTTVLQHLFPFHQIIPEMAGRQYLLQLLIFPAERPVSPELKKISVYRKTLSIFAELSIFVDCLPA
jgi:hypothetical protein